MEDGCRSAAMRGSDTTENSGSHFCCSDRRQVLTFFATAKAFQGHSGIIQRNALKSWTLLNPDVEVILFGDDEGAAEVCAELCLRHEPQVKRHESGMKYLDYMLDRAQKIA